MQPLHDFRATMNADHFALNQHFIKIIPHGFVFGVFRLKNDMIMAGQRTV